MATPLDFSLEGLTPEQQRALQSFRRAGASTPGVGTITPQQMELARSAQRPLADIAGERPPTARAAPVAPSAPAASAAKLTTGQKALRFARGATSLNPLKNPIIKGAGVLTGVTALARGVADTAARTPEELSGRQADTTTRQLGLDPTSLPGRGVRAALDAAQSGFERLPVLPGLMNLAAGLPYSGEAAPTPAEVQAAGAPQATPTTPTAAPTTTLPFESPAVTALRPGSAAARTAGAFLEGRGVPDTGRGVLRNDQTGALTTFAAEPRGQVLTAAAPQSVSAPQPVAAPQLGTRGGIFTNLVQFQRDLGQSAMAGAQDTRAFRHGEASRAADVEQQRVAGERSKAAFDAALRVAGLDIQQQAADTARIAAEARSREQVEVIPGLPGEAPLLVGKQTGQARRATVVPSFEEFSARMAEDPRNAALTPEQMLAAYQELFGQ